MANLGPIASYQVGGAGGSEKLWIEITSLESGETISGTPIITTTTASVTISEVAANSAAITKDDGSTIAVGHAIEFRATINAEMNTQAPLICSCTTTAGNKKRGIAYLDVVSLLKT